MKLKKSSAKKTENQVLEKQDSKKSVSSKKTSKK